jgi:hypothetical protein
LKDAKQGHFNQVPFVETVRKTFKSKVLCPDIVERAIDFRFTITVPLRTSLALRPILQPDLSSRE